MLILHYLDDIMVLGHDKDLVAHVTNSLVQLLVVLFLQSRF